jgi:hypothetical protein
VLAEFVTQTNVTDDCNRLQENEKKWYGIDLWWEIIQDETDVPPATATEAFRFLETFLTWLYCHELRPKYIGLCMQNLKEGKSVPFSLKLLQKLIGIHLIPAPLNLVRPRVAAFISRIEL